MPPRSSHLLALLPAAIAALIFTLSLCACPPPQGPERPDGSAQVEPKLALAYSGAVSALVLLDKLHADRIASIAKATPEQIAEIETTTMRLKRARDGLRLVRDWIEGKTQDKQAAFEDAVEALKLVLSELQASGVKIPGDVDAGLAAAEALLGVNPG